tara:strand:+ start:1128 stop:1598 length:471 start_codon:yes stop_codon:yes gene_type:complete
MSDKTKHSTQLNVGKNIVSLNDQLAYSGIEINYFGDVDIISLLPNSYLFKKKHNKIIILKVNQHSDIKTDLFKFKGKIQIVRCKIVNYNLENYFISINHQKLDLWESISSNWENVTTNWENLDYDGYNNKKYYIDKTLNYDKETRTYTTTKEIRKR